jgi:hypothetical protein
MFYSPLLIAINYLFYAFLVITSSLYVINRVAPGQSNLRIQFHCLLGFITLIIGLIYSFTFYIILEWSQVITVCILFFIIGTGTILRYMPNAGSIRFHSSSLHSALVFSLFVIIILNVWLN